MLDFLYPKYYLSAEGEGEGEGGGGEDPGAGGEESGGGDSGGGRESGGSDVVSDDTIQYLTEDVALLPPDTELSSQTITEIVLDSRPIAQAEVNRLLTVRGGKGSTFNLFLKQIDSSNNVYFYNFNTGVWGPSSSTLIIIPDNGIYSIVVQFPKTTVNNKYHFQVVPISGTVIGIGSRSDFFQSQTIYQYIDTDITFSLSTAEGDFDALPSNVVSSGLRGVASSDVSLDWDVSVSANSFIVNRQPTVNDFKTSRNDIYITNGTGSSSTSLILDDISNLVPGLSLTAVASGGVSGSPVIVSINEDTKTITLSVAQSWGDNKAITFTGYGGAGFDLYNAIIATTSMSVVLDDVTTTTTSLVSANTTVPVTSVNGLKEDTAQTVDGATSSSIYVTLDSVANLWIGQALVNVSSGTLDGTPTIVHINDVAKTLTLSSEQTFPDPCTIKFANNIVSGVGIDDSTTNPYIDSISSLNLTLSAAQTLENGIELTFTGTSRAATIAIEVKIIKLGDTNFTTTLQLDNILTVL